MQSLILTISQSQKKVTAMHGWLEKKILLDPCNYLLRGTIKMNSHLIFFHLSFPVIMTIQAFGTSTVDPDFEIYGVFYNFCLLKCNNEQKEAFTLSFGTT